MIVMKNILLFMFTLFLFGCNSFNNSEKGIARINKEILPIKMTLKWEFQDYIEDVGRVTPDIHFSIDVDTVEIRIGATEIYYLPYENTSLFQIFDNFKVSDFKSNKLFYCKYFEVDFWEIEKEIEGEIYRRQFSNYKTADLPPNSVGLDDASVMKFARLSDYLKAITFSLLRDNYDKSNMIIAHSMEEALENPEKVYELNLSRLKETSISSDIGQLVNLRILNLRGSDITSIPNEIEHCIHLKTIVAEGSRLSKIPSSIGNLKKIRNLDLAHCKIKSLPDELGQLESLWSSDLSSNQLKNLPDGISNLKNVQLFAISNNNFNEFPMEVLELESVSNLHINGNNFKSIPTEISQLKSLTDLFVDTKEIENMEEIKRLLPKLKVLDYELTFN